MSRQSALALPAPQIDHQGPSSRQQQAHHSLQGKLLTQTEPGEDVSQAGKGQSGQVLEAADSRPGPLRGRMKGRLHRPQRQPGVLVLSQGGLSIPSRGSFRRRTRWQRLSRTGCSSRRGSNTISEWAGTPDSQCGPDQWSPSPLRFEGGRVRRCSQEEWRSIGGLTQPRLCAVAA
jgi:hypothetical protein